MPLEFSNHIPGARAPMRLTFFALVAFLAGVLTHGGEQSSTAAKRRAVRANAPLLVDLDSGEFSDRSPKPSWGPEQVEGPPDVLRAGDSTQAWASLSADGQREWLLCEYERAVPVRAVVVHENDHPGALFRVSAFNSDGDEVVAWEGTDPTPRSKPRGVSVIPIKLDFPVQRIRVSLDSPAVAGWNEIDAIGLEDADGTRHWARHVEASTSYASPRAPGNRTNSKPAYSAGQAAGEPDTAQPGDSATAWASQAADGGPEWLILRFKTAQMPAEIVVHENAAPGAISKISVFDDEDKETTIWEGVDPTPRNQPWGVSVFPVQAEFPFRRLKLYIDSQAVPGWNEIDAVGLRSRSGETQWATDARASSEWGRVRRGRMTPNVMEVRPEAGVRELKEEVQTLRKELNELRDQLKELGELKERLKESTK